jgi:Protein of unknown function (DUF2934)
MKLKEGNMIMKPVSPKKVIFAIEPRTIEEEIRVRAYELFETRGGEDGRDQEDWFRAEEEVTGRIARNVAA